jgi:hypothetical protein
VLVDGTFKIASHPFYQVLIVMAYDQSISCYVPCVHALLAGKNEWIYLRGLSEIIMQLDYQWEPKAITCNFKIGLIKALKQEFPNVTINGHTFHWKQAL